MNNQNQSTKQVRSLRGEGKKLCKKEVLMYKRPQIPSRLIVQSPQQRTSPRLHPDFCCCCCCIALASPVSYHFRLLMRADTDRPKRSSTQHERHFNLSHTYPLPTIPDHPAALMLQMQKHSIHPHEAISTLQSKQRKERKKENRKNAMKSASFQSQIADCQSSASQLQF
jgi:hypothetical protein